jgi:hypothetical protein
MTGDGLPAQDLLNRALFEDTLDDGYVRRAVDMLVISDVCP